MKLQDVILKAMAKKISWLEAAEIIGVSDRTMRRMRERYQEFGYTGLLDQREESRASHRVPMETAEEVLRLYREVYFDLNMRHFHEKLRDEHQIELSYTWVQQALQGAGLVAKRRKRGPHRRRRPRRPMPGMLLHIDGSKHRWLQRRALARPDRDSGRCHQRDLLRATGGGGIDADGDGGLAGSDRNQGPVLRAVQRPGQPFLCDAEGGREGGQAPPDAGGAGDEGVGSADDSRPTRRKPGAERAQLRDLAGAACRKSCGWRK